MLPALKRWLIVGLGLLGTLSLCWFLLSRSFPAQTLQLEAVARQELLLVEQRAEQELVLVKESVLTQKQRLRQQGSSNENNLSQKQHDTTTTHDSDIVCPYTSLNDLTVEERHPIAGPHRHMVTPPADDGVALVCCTTTQGPWNVLVHHAWAPHGARRFLDLVETHYFDTTIPLMRCVRNFLCQFGLNGIPAVMKPFKQSIPDDPNWLPEGPDHRQNQEHGVKRFQRGYLAYAGAGPQSRNLQLIVALRDNGHLAGGSPWEVPWGELVGTHSYETLDKIHTGYGEHGPKQGSLWKANALEQVRQLFPNLDYVQGCRVVDTEGELGIPLSTRADYRPDKK